MKVSKPILSVVSLMFSAIIVYGTALVTRLFKGHFLLENGLSNFGYILLTLDIAVPIILYILIANGIYKNHIFEVISFAGLFILLVFFPVYFSSVSENSNMNLVESKRFIIVILVMVVLFVATSHFAVNDKKLEDRFY